MTVHYPAFSHLTTYAAVHDHVALGFKAALLQNYINHCPDSPDLALTLSSVFQNHCTRRLRHRVPRRLPRQPKPPAVRGGPHPHLLHPHRTTTARAVQKGSQATRTRTHHHLHPDCARAPAATHARPRLHRQAHPQRHPATPPDHLEPGGPRNTRSTAARNQQTRLRRRFAATPKNSPSPGPRKWSGRFSLKEQQ